MTSSTAAAALAPLRDDLAASAILLDLDGTLAPIIDRPQDVAIIDGAREVIQELAGRAALVGFVSGRGLADLERIVDVPGLAYAGNHGMEFRRPGTDPAPAPEVLPHLASVAAFAEGLDPAELARHGVSLEDKGATLSLHYRTADDPGAARRWLEGEVADRARTAGLLPTRGRMILEVRPPVALDKGTAVRALVLGCGARHATFVGDDVTDIDGWRALRALADEGHLATAVAVAAGGDELADEVRAAADVIVAGPGGALEVLRHLAGAGGAPR